MLARILRSLILLILSISLADVRDPVKFEMATVNENYQVRQHEELRAALSEYLPPPLLGGCLAFESLA